MDVRLTKKCCSSNRARSLLSNSENREHLKNFRNVDCVLANYNKVQDTRANLKPQTNYRCCLRFSYLAPYWLISRNTISFHKYFWCSRFCEFHSKLHLSGLQSGARFFLANHHAAIYPIAGVNLKLS